MRLVHSPNQFVIGEYASGFTIDFREPAEITDLERLRRSFDASRLAGASSDAELVRIAGSALVELGVTEHERDFDESLRAHTGDEELRAQLRATLHGLGVADPPEDPVQGIMMLFEQTGCLQRSRHFPLRLLCHPEGGTSRLEHGSTHYGYVLEGECTLTANGRATTLWPNTYFCVRDEAIVEGRGKCVLITRFGFQGMTMFGGEVEDWGRLEYIDGCTDTLLIAPPKKGDPCFNALYFPPATLQTAHVHPSVRCGAVIAGEGLCRTRTGDFPLRKGDVFFLPPETLHSFCTSDGPVEGRASLSVVAFHPDSDFGPTDEDHPMLNRTYFKFLHRLESTASTLETKSGPRSS